jgi:hypothetical protein
MRYEVEYPKRATILLIFLEVDSYEGEPVNRVFESIRWAEKTELGEHDFLDGDVAFVKRLISGHPPL